MTVSTPQQTKTYTAVTFAPVQGFIEKSRKLRDLYGSSFILSYIAWCICLAANAKGCKVVSPSLPNVTQGMPNQIIIEGKLEAADAQAALKAGWQSVVNVCRYWLQGKLDSHSPFRWDDSWEAWKNHTWEFFCVHVENGTVTQVRQRMNHHKRSRNWVGINWTGESSTLSGSDSICRPGMDCYNPKTYRYTDEKNQIRQFYQDLSNQIGESIIDPREELSIPELIKRLIAVEDVNRTLIDRLKNTPWWQTDIAPWWQTLPDKEADQINQDLKELQADLTPATFKSFDRLNPDQKRSQGWFLGDGDNAARYMQRFAGAADEAERITQFSATMRQWGANFKKRPPPHCRIVYAGGDDFMGIFHNPNAPLAPSQCLEWLSTFKSKVWQQDSKPITVSVGFVWAAPDVPQREVLQHCRDAEKAAKDWGRNRVALRVLFNSGNYLEWVCPWDLLEQGLLTHYLDRQGQEGFTASWTQFFKDVAVLEARHAFTENQIDVAQGLLRIYFPGLPMMHTLLTDQIWNDDARTHAPAGILGDQAKFSDNNDQNGLLPQTKVNRALNNWVINLAKVGFHLCSTI